MLSYGLKVREQCGITFEDPDSGQEESYPGLTQMVLADVRFSMEPDPALSVTRVMGFISGESFFIGLPLVNSWLPEKMQSKNVATDKFQTIYRIGCVVPPKFGIPPHAPPTEYLQSLLNSFGPPFLSSDPSVNPNPIQITETVWSTRFRNRAAIASRFFTRFGDDKSGGVIFLVGDAAHIHSPGKRIHKPSKRIITHGCASGRSGNESWIARRDRFGTSPRNSFQVLKHDTPPARS
jgi:hypothetical protein